MYIQKYMILVDETAEIFGYCYKKYLMNANFFSILVQVFFIIAWFVVLKPVSVFYNLFEKACIWVFDMFLLKI